MVISEDDCINALQQAAEQLGKSPSRGDYDMLQMKPAVTTIVRNLGGWNEAKKQAGLKTYRSRGSRIQPPPEDVDLPEDLDWYDMSCDQRWHYKNVEWNTKRTLLRRSRLRNWLTSLKERSNGCLECGEKNPYCLDFHHRKDEERLMSVSRMVPSGYGKDRISEEIENCDILCANCHRIHHAGPLSTNSRPRRYEHRSWILKFKAQSNGCCKCDMSNPHCLDFHHREGTQKSGTVSELVNYDLPKEDLKIEIEKCDILCANCHRIKHLAK